MSWPRLVIERAPRRLDLPWFVWAIVVVWAALVLLRELTKPPSAGPLCLFRRATDLPCPTCGATRGVMSLLGGHPLQALAYNPLVMVAVLLGLAWLVARVGFGRRVRLDATVKQQTWTWVAIGLLFLANWAWILMRET